MATELPRTLKIVTVWLLLGNALFLGLQAGRQAEQRRARTNVDGGAVELRRAPDGHFRWPGRVNGIAVDFLVDTGATRTALPATLAARAGIETESRVLSRTSPGGVVEGFTARADVVLRRRCARRAAARDRAARLGRAAARHGPTGAAALQPAGGRSPAR